MRLLISMSFLIVVIVLTAGCSQMQANTSSQSPPSDQEAGLSSGDGSQQYPAPPEDIAVSAQINDKDLTDKAVNVYFSGGDGQKMVKRSWIIIQRSDGTSEQVSLIPRVQSGVTLQGSSGEDIVRVFAEYYDGKTYLIAEKKVRMRQRL